MNDLSEKEQLEALRAWWAEYRAVILSGVAIGVISIFGLNQYRANVEQSAVAASVLFEDVMEATARGNLDAAEKATETLFSEYESSVYADEARLALARLYMDFGRDKDAADALQTLVDSSSSDEISLVARLRLAKILLYQAKAQEALDLIAGNDDTAFSSRFSEILGDAHAALGQYAEAEAAYRAALEDNPLARTVDRDLVQLKINDLPAVNESADSESEATVSIDLATPSPTDTAAGETEENDADTGEAQLDPANESDSGELQ